MRFQFPIRLFTRMVHDVEVRAYRNGATSTSGITSPGIEAWPKALEPGNTPKAARYANYDINQPSNRPRATKRGVRKVR